MNSYKSFSEGSVEGVAKILGECASGTDISSVLASKGIKDISGESTKWRRLNFIFLDSQNKNGHANTITDLISSFLAPVKFIRRLDQFESSRREINAVLAFESLEYGKDGCFRTVEAIKTIDEAEKRLSKIQTMFKGRTLHIEVVKYCRVELLQDNYFHAVFEASKGLAERIRNLSGVHKDGSALVDLVFLGDSPLLSLNTLQTETEKSEHKGFASLLKGCFAAARNPLAHQPKVLWNGSEDAVDWLSLISLLHRKLDSCVRTQLSLS